MPSKVWTLLLAAATVLALTDRRAPLPAGWWTPPAPRARRWATSHPVVGRAWRVKTITADCGGSNGNRPRLWKVELQKLADETGLEIKVCHFSPGTSKWNKIEIADLFFYKPLGWLPAPIRSVR